MTTNKFGLMRDIPEEVALLVRQRSRFGCVICRCGFYQYEHITPFTEVSAHNADEICCLCAFCHNEVTAGRYSKNKVADAYRAIQAEEKTKPPVGPLDFSAEEAHIAMGGITYPSTIRTVLRYHGWDLIRIEPKTAIEPPGISAFFTDNTGQIALRLMHNVWVGALENWDIKVTGRQITVRRQKGEIVLQLLLEPPGRIIIKKLDMRFRGGHILATDRTYAVGRYVSQTCLVWLHVDMVIESCLPNSAAIEFIDSESLEVRDMFLSGMGQEMATEDRGLVMHSSGGVYAKHLGICIGGFSPKYGIANFMVSREYRVDEMRRIVFSKPEKLGNFFIGEKV